MSAVRKVDQESAQNDSRNGLCIVVQGHCPASLIPQTLQRLSHGFWRGTVHCKVRNCTTVLLLMWNAVLCFQLLSSALVFSHYALPTKDILIKQSCSYFEVYAHCTIKFIIRICCFCSLNFVLMWNAALCFQYCPVHWGSHIVRCRRKIYYTSNRVLTLKRMRTARLSLSLFLFSQLCVVMSSRQKHCSLKWWEWFVSQRWSLTYRYESWCIFCKVPRHDAWDLTIWR